MHPKSYQYGTSSKPFPSAIFMTNNMHMHPKYDMYHTNTTPPIPTCHGSASLHDERRHEVLHLVQVRNHFALNRFNLRLHAHHFVAIVGHFTHEIRLE
jgi:hypothetical protein